MVKALPIKREVKKNLNIEGEQVFIESPEMTFIREGILKESSSEYKVLSNDVYLDGISFDGITYQYTSRYEDKFSCLNALWEGKRSNKVKLLGFNPVMELTLLEALAEYVFIMFEMSLEEKQDIFDRAIRKLSKEQGKGYLQTLQSVMSSISQMLSNTDYSKFLEALQL